MSAAIDPVPLSEKQLSELNGVLFGQSAQSNDVDRWHHAGFVYDTTVTFGLLQQHGGPCGILAPVQAYILHNLLFVQNITADDKQQLPFSITAEQQQHTLITVLLDMLLRTAYDKQTIVIVLGESLNNLHTYTSIDTKQLYTLLHEHYTILQSDIGIILFVYSLLLTHTVEQIKLDTDDNTQPLIARFAHTTQELVNLCITGSAVSNVFNGIKSLDQTGLVLKGIDKQYNIGYLTLLESMRYSEVGSYYKQPLTPIYVIASETHYTVLFGIDKSIGQQSPQQQLISQLKQVFDQFDQDNAGFISADHISTLLQMYECNHITDEHAMKQLDPDSMGIVLWQNMLEALKQWLPNKFVTQPSNQPFTCTACTYENTGNRTRCEICDTARAAEQEPTDHKSFIMYHYNGLQSLNTTTNTKSTQCIRVLISLTDLDMQQAGQTTNGRSLIDVIQTRWINAIVGYDNENVEPKIT